MSAAPRHEFGTQHRDGGHKAGMSGCSIAIGVSVGVVVLLLFGAWLVPAVAAVLLGLALLGGWGGLLVLGWLYQPTRRLMIDTARERFPDTVTVTAVRDFDTHLRGALGIIVGYLVVLLVLGVLVGLSHRRTRWSSAGAMIAWVLVPVFAIGALAGSRIGRRRARVLATPPASASSDTSSHQDGGHVGFDGSTPISAPSRGGLLVIGPPGSGKSSGSIIPSIWTAPGAVVVSSIKTDLLLATQAHRSTRGQLWLFDLAGDELPAGVLQVRWSPLAAVTDWDSARRMATSMTAPMRSGDNETGAHFLDRAKAWTECLLFAGHLSGAGIGTVADWVAVSMSDEGMLVAHAALIDARDAGNPDAHLAERQLEGILATPERERGSIASTMQRVFSVYQSSVARSVGREPNFDPAAFVRSTDTLYITAAPDRATEFAPLIAGLLEAIRFAQYARHRTEPGGAHLTFVLDEANNTAPIPLPAIVSEAGGQGLHVIVGIQDLSRARERWGKAADGFLTLFGTKLVLSGVIEPFTLDALSNAAGEYDRTMSTVSRDSTALLFPDTHVSTTTQRTKVLHQGDIAHLRAGHGLLFQGADWREVEIRNHYTGQWVAYR